MKNIYAEFDEKDKVYIISYGRETDSKKARWGRGQRNSVIVHYVTKGEGYFNDHRVKEGEGFLIKRNQIHQYFSSSDKPWEYFWVILDGEEAETLVQSFVSADDRGIFPYDFKEKLIDFSKEFFINTEKLSRAKALGVFYLLMSYHEQKEKITGNRYVTEAKKYMEENLYRKISIKEVAKELFISDRYLYNLFIMHESVPPKTYLNSLRIKKACTLLKNKNLTITEVAVSVGFNDVLTFSRFFSKNMKKSPTEYRWEYHNF